MSQRPPIPLNERLYRTEAIVLARLDYGEADRIVTVMTPRRGKFRVIAKGARKPLSRLGPHLDFFCRSRLLLAKGRELDVVSEAATVDSYPRLRSDLDALGHASHMAEMANRLTEDRQENEAAYDLLAQSLRLLDEAVDPWLVTRHFEWALLTTLGYRPELYRCLSCGNPLQAEPNGWSCALGGHVCPECGALAAGSRIVSLGAQKVLRLLDREGLAALARIRIDPGLRGEVEAMLADYLRHLTERDLASMKVLRAIQRA